MLTFAQVSSAAIRQIETNLRGYIAPGPGGPQLQLEPLGQALSEQLHVQTDEQRKRLHDLLTEWTHSLYARCLLTNRAVRARTEFVRQQDQVEGYDYRPGDAVQIGQPLDTTMNADYQGRAGAIRHLLTAEQQVLPLIAVQFDNGKTLHFWPQELRPLA